MTVVLCLSVLLTVHRSISVYRSFSALVALIEFTHTDKILFADVYASFAADGCIFHLETLARSLGDTCAEKEYLLALVDLGRAMYMTTALSEPEDDTTIRTELLEAIHLQQYVPSPPIQSCLIVVLQSAQRRLCCFHWKSVHRPCKSIQLPLLLPSLPFLLHR